MRLFPTTIYQSRSAHSSSLSVPSRSVWSERHLSLVCRVRHCAGAGACRRVDMARVLHVTRVHVGGRGWVLVKLRPACISNVCLISGALARYCLSLFTVTSLLYDTRARFSNINRGGQNNLYLFVGQEELRKCIFLMREAKLNLNKCELFFFVYNSLLKPDF